VTNPRTGVMAKDSRSDCERDDCEGGPVRVTLSQLSVSEGNRPIKNCYVEIFSQPRVTDIFLRGPIHLLLRHTPFRMCSGNVGYQRYG